MATASTTFKQDMPPPGGYAPIQWQRVPQKKMFNGWMLLPIYFGMMGYGYFKFMQWKYFLKKLEVEKYDIIIGMTPFLEAEQDRIYLRQLWINREEEKRLFKNRPDWKVGTLFGEPIFKTIGSNGLPDLPLMEIYAHRPEMEWYNTCWPDMWM